ncbi:MAG TPA: RNA methyltransferase, partial [Acidimicrobiia bacterium]
SERDRTGRFPVEGLRVVARALAAGWPVDEIVLSPELATPEAVELAGNSRAPVTELGPEAFRRVAYRQKPDGILAVALTRPLPLAGLTVPDHGFVLVMEAIEKPGNLGAVLRTADAAGVDAVVAADPATDPFNPNVVRASQGSLFAVPLAVAGAAETLGWLDGRGSTVHVARPEGGPPPWEVDLAAGGAVVVGSEHAGVSSVWDRCPAVTLPMAGTADSLNAAITASVVAYEARRQRGPRR